MEYRIKIETRANGAQIFTPEYRTTGYSWRKFYNLHDCIIRCHSQEEAQRMVDFDRTQEEHRLGERIVSVEFISA